MTNATRCLACGTETQDGDFCPNPSCRQYLAWDLPEEQVAHTPESLAPTSTQDTTGSVDLAPETDIPPPRRRAAALSLVDFDELESGPCQVLAGGQRRLTVEIRNQSTIVDEYKLSVRNIPAEWWSVDPVEGIHLLPFGAGRRESSLGQAVISLTPPRSSEAVAGERQIVIAVRSVATDEEVANVAITIDILPFQAVRGSIHPDASPPRRRRGNFTFTVRNTSNSFADLVIGGYNPSERCGVSVTPTTLHLDPGRQSDVTVVVRPAIPQLVGRATAHTIHLYAEPTGTALPSHEPESLAQRLFRAGSAQATKEGGAIAKKAKTKAPKPPKVPKVPKGLATGARALAGGGGDQERASAEDAEAPTAAAAPASEVPVEAPPGKQVDPTAYVCTYRQRAWIPWWTIIVVALVLVAIGVLIYKDIHKVTVPGVIRHPISPARNEIDAGHLNPVEHASPGCRLRIDNGKLLTVHGKLQCAVSPRKRRHKPCAAVVRPKFPAGDVYKEVPAASTRVAPNTVVILCTKVVAGKARVPDLFGMKSQVAIQTLARDGFAIGDIEPYPPPQGQVVVRQSEPPRKEECRSKKRGVFPCRSKKVNVTLGVVAEIPNFVGQPLAKARQKVEKAALEIGQPAKLKHKSGIVVGQLPSAGSIVIAGHKVKLILGSRVPRLGGLNAAAVRAKLRRVGLTIDTQPGLRAPDNTVAIAQSPKHGTLLRAHNAVYVLFGASVPNLMGHTLAHARKTLAAVSLDLGKTPGPPVPDHAVVMTQTPKHGSPLKAHGVVHVGFGARVPNLFGRTVADANTALAAAGLDLGKVSPSVVPPVRAVVVTQAIPRKRLVRLGTKVNVALGTTVPDLSNMTVAEATDDLKKLHLTLGTVAKMVQPGYTGPPVIADQSKAPGTLAHFKAKIGVKTLVAPPPKKAANSPSDHGSTKKQAQTKAAH